MSVCIHACIQNVCYNGWGGILAKECPQEPVKEGNEGKSLFLLFYSIVSPSLSSRCNLILWSFPLRMTCFAFKTRTESPSDEEKNNNKKTPKATANQLINQQACMKTEEIREGDTVVNEACKTFGRREVQKS